MKTFALPLGLACALQCGATMALPDMARGLAAMQAGNVDMADRDLRPLAELGYLDAQRALARLYGDLDTPEGAAESARWYRRAAQQDPAMRLPLVRVLLRAGPLQNPGEVQRLLHDMERNDQALARPLQLRLYRDYPQLTDETRAALLAGQVAASERVEDRAEAMGWYRDHREKPAYEKALAALCEKDRRAVEECYPDLARHFRAVPDPGALLRLRTESLRQYAEQRMSADTLERAARNLVSDDLPGKPAPEIAYALLAAIANPDPDVLARKARLLLAQPNLDPTVNAQDVLKDAYARGSAEAALQLGRLYLDETYPDADPHKAQGLLAEAAKTLPSAHTWLGRLYERGYLGRPDPARALRHYLIAARAGFANADFALARMYRGNRGIRVDAVQAYTFARLAEQQAYPGADAFVAELQAGMTNEEIAQAQTLASQEWTARAAAAPQQAEASLARLQGSVP